MRTGPAAALSRRFSAAIAAGGAFVLLLLSGLASYAYLRAYDDVLERHRLATVSRALGLEQVAGAVRQHVAVMSGVLRDGLETDLSPAPESDTPGGLEDTPDPGPARGAVVSLPGALDRPGERAELSAAEALFPLQRAARRAMPQLSWTYVFDADRAFAVIYPWAPASQLFEGHADSPARFESWFSYDVFLDALPERNPERTPFWTPVYADAVGQGLMVSHGVPVDSGGRFRAVVGADLLVSYLADYLGRFAPLAGRFVLVDQRGGAVADAEAQGGLSGEVVPARTLLGGGVPEALPRPEAGWVLAGADHLLAVGVAGTPWQLLHAVPRFAVRADALRDVVPYLVLAASILAGLAALYLVLSRQFVQPAARLADYARALANGGDFPPRPAVPPLWEPWFADLEEAVRERRRLVALSREAETLKAAVLDVALDAVIITDGGGRVIGFNPGAERILGYRAADAMGKQIGDLIVPEASRAAHEAGLARFRDTGEAQVLVRRMEVEAERADGALFPAELSIHHVRAGDRHIFAAYLRDLTEQRAAAAEMDEQRRRIHQIEKLSAMGSLLAGVAHELNNPLAILIAQATLLRDKADTPDVRRRAERIHAAAERSGRIVKSFLAMARQEAPRREPVSLQEVVKAALEMTAYGARSGGIEVSASFAPGLPPVEADRDLLGQVVANLLINAQQSLLSQVGPRRIAVRTLRADGGVALDVEDNGPGVPAANAARIFEPYFTTKPAGAGTGIGLSICRNVVEAHGGSITLNPAQGGGALFRVVLPAAWMPELTDASAAPRTADVLKVLVIDDEPDMASALAEVMEALGHRAVIADGAAAALAAARGDTFDAVFSDLRMPLLGGIELRRLLVTEHPHLAGRVVLVTGDTVLGVASLRTGGGKDDDLILEKPFTFEEVRAVLQRATRARMTISS